MTERNEAWVAQIAHHTPPTKLSNEELAAVFPRWSAAEIDRKLGIQRRSIASPTEFTSDLAIAAARCLFSAGRTDAKEVDYLILCTQTPDYLLPASACIVHHALGLRKSSGAIDVNQGCSGYVYGLSLARGLVESHQASTVLLLTADTYSKLLRPDDGATRTVFGDAGSATLVVARPRSGMRIGRIMVGTDGSGADFLIARDRAMRPAEPGASQGLSMNGAEIFAFASTVVPRLVSDLLAAENLNTQDVDFFVFHQANTYMLEHLRGLCKIPAHKFVTCLADTGNTVSSTIPIALSQLMDDARARHAQRVMLVGFGVGLSWGACMLHGASDSRG